MKSLESSDVAPQGAPEHTNKVQFEPPPEVARPFRDLLWGRSAKLLVLGLGIIAAWQAVVSLGLVSQFVLPSPAATLTELVATTGNLVSGGYVFSALVVTSTEVLAGFGLALIAGVAIGVVAGATRFGQDAIMPYMVAINSMPKIAFAPVFVAWLGFGLAPKILLAAFIAFFPVVVNTAVGVKAYSENEGLLFESMEASRWETLIHLRFPTALPYIFAGMKTAAVLSVIGAIVAEFMGGNGQGMGELIRLSSGLLRFDNVFSLILLLSILGSSLFALISLAEKRVLHWHRSTIDVL